MNEIKVSINRNGLLSKKIIFKILYNVSIDFNKHVHDIDIFINDKWRKYVGGDIWRLFKITRRLELRFWPTRKQSQPSQGDFFALQREPWYTLTEITVLLVSFYSQSYSFPSFFLEKNNFILLFYSLKSWIHYTSEYLHILKTEPFKE
jgi:hypothetical protein